MRESRNERVPVALPAEQVAAVRRVVDAGAAESVAAYVAEAVRGRLAATGRWRGSMICTPAAA
jgi:hypothetical protein